MRKCTAFIIARAFITSRWRGRPEGDAIDWVRGFRFDGSRLAPVGRQAACESLKQAGWRALAPSATLNRSVSEGSPTLRQGGSPNGVVVDASNPFTDLSAVRCRLRRARRYGSETRPKTAIGCNTPQLRPLQPACHAERAAGRLRRCEPVTTVSTLQMGRVRIELTTPGFSVLFACENSQENSG